MRAVLIALKSSAEPRNDQVRANRDNENGNEQPVHFEAPPNSSIPQTQAHALFQNFAFCNRGKLRLQPGPGFCVLQQRERDPGQRHHAALANTTSRITRSPGSRASPAQTLLSASVIHQRVTNAPHTGHDARCRKRTTRPNVAFPAGLGIDPELGPEGRALTTQAR
jgi:hypothetical protein